MDGVRAKITPTLEADGMLQVQIDWVRVEGGVPGEVLSSESFRVSPARAGCAYFSRAVAPASAVSEGTFWLDEDGRRHFLLDARPAALSATGKEI